MCRLRNCCCCLDLRTGTITISVAIIVIGIIRLIIKLVADNYSVKWMKAFDITMTVLVVVLGLVLLIGAILNNKTIVGVCAIALIFFIAISLLVLFVLIIVAAVNANEYPWILVWSDGALTAGFVIGVIGALVDIGLNIYFTLVVWSYYRELRTGQTGSPFA